MTSPQVADLEGAEQRFGGLFGSFGYPRRGYRPGILSEYLSLRVSVNIQDTK